jgi:type II secretory pathway pseudopilin PulG
MLSLSQKSVREDFARSRARSRFGFTFIEVVMGITVLTLTAGVVLYGLNQLNYQASVNRLYTAAQTLAQNQIDLILTMGPYDPATDKYPLPAHCGVSSSTNTILRTDVTKYYWDPAPAANVCPMSTAEKKITIYKDPMNNNKIVEGTIETTVKTTPFVDTTGATLDVRQATVKVIYTFRRRNYTVAMDTMRTSDK